jgi:hypothetical protein
MTKEEIYTGNVLIAEFIGMEDVESGWQDKNNVLNIPPLHRPRTNTFVMLKFHSSWDWLMPVVEKINNSCFLGLTTVTMFNNGTQIVVYDLKWDKEPFNCYPKINTQEAIKLSVTFNAVIRYIEWYNYNKNKED